jgi:hypothetical protein
MAEGIGRLSRSSIGSEELRRLNGIDFQRPEVIQLHAKLFAEQFEEWDIDVVSLVVCADQCDITYGEALASLQQYRRVARAWRLPDAIGEGIAAQRTCPGMFEMFSSTEGDQMDGEKWALLAMRASAITGHPLAEIAAGAVPLLDAFGADTSVLSALAGLVPGPVHFDHLVVAGCLQMLPAGTDKAELEAMARPFANEPAELAPKAAVLAQLPDMKWRETG